jgi:hypothetical protein
MESLRWDKQLFSVEIYVCSLLQLINAPHTHVWQIILAGIACANVIESTFRHINTTTTKNNNNVVFFDCESPARS